MTSEFIRPLLSEVTRYENLFFFSGQIGKRPDTGELAGATITEQIEQVSRNIESALAKYGMSMSNIIKANCYLTDMSLYNDFNVIYAKHFTSSPARTCVAVKELPFGALCEIEVVAIKD